MGTHCLSSAFFAEDGNLFLRILKGLGGGVRFCSLYAVSQQFNTCATTLSIFVVEDLRIVLVTLSYKLLE